MLQKMGVLFVVMAVTFVGPALAATDVGVNDASGDYGTTVDVPINVSSTSNIGAMDISLTYNPAVISPTGVANGTLISTTDLIGSYTGTSGIVNVSIASTSGITGTGSIAIVQFHVLGFGGTTSPLTLSTVVAYDLDSPIYNESCNCTVYEELLDVTTSSATFAATGEAALTGDISGDDKVNYKDLGILGASYGLSLGEAGYNAAADLNGDDKVNYKDLGMLGAHYGESV